jgi:hypothetical protein
MARRLKISLSKCERAVDAKPCSEHIVARLKAMEKDGNGEVMTRGEARRRRAVGAGCAPATSARPLTRPSPRHRPQLDLNEIAAAVGELVSVEKDRRLLKWPAIVACVALLTVAATVGLTFAVVKLSQDVSVSRSNAMVAKGSGAALETGANIRSAMLASAISIMTSPDPAALLAHLTHLTGVHGVASAALLADGAGLCVRTAGNETFEFAPTPRHPLQMPPASAPPLPASAPGLNLSLTASAAGLNLQAGRPPRLVRRQLLMCRVAHLEDSDERRGDATRDPARGRVAECRRRGERAHGKGLAARLHRLPLPPPLARRRGELEEVVWVRAPTRELTRPHRSFVALKCERRDTAVILSLSLTLQDSKLTRSYRSQHRYMASLCARLALLLACALAGAGRRARALTQPRAPRAPRLPVPILTPPLRAARSLRGAPAPRARPPRRRARLALARVWRPHLGLRRGGLRRGAAGGALCGPRGDRRPRAHRCAPPRAAAAPPPQ